jgi:hypothetical protein
VPARELSKVRSPVQPDRLIGEDQARVPVIYWDRVPLTRVTSTEVRWTRVALRPLFPPVHRREDVMCAAVLPVYH